MKKIELNFHISVKRNVLKNGLISIQKRSSRFKDMFENIIKRCCKESFGKG